SRTRRSSSRPARRSTSVRARSIASGSSATGRWTCSWQSCPTTSRRTRSTTKTAGRCTATASDRIGRTIRWVGEAAGPRGSRLARWQKPVDLTTLEAELADFERDGSLDEDASLAARMRGLDCIALIDETVRIRGRLQDVEPLRQRAARLKRRILAANRRLFAR